MNVIYLMNIVTEFHVKANGVCSIFTLFLYITDVKYGFSNLNIKYKLLNLINSHIIWMKYGILRNTIFIYTIYYKLFFRFASNSIWSWKTNTFKESKECYKEIMRCYMREPILLHCIIVTGNFPLTSLLMMLLCSFCASNVIPLIRPVSII